MPSPLTGVSVVVTRAAHQAQPFVDLLVAEGAVVVRCPLIEIADPSDGGVALRDALRNVEDYDWIVFTSANTVDRVLGLADLAIVQVAAIGASTARALQEQGVAVSLVAEEAVGEALVDAFPQGVGSVLLPQAAGARAVVADGLRAKGWTVEVVEAYRTIDVGVDEDLAAEVVSADVVTFLSSSAVAAFMERLGVDQLPSLIATIGPVTSQTARDCGIEVDIEAQDHTAEGLIAAMADYVRLLRNS